MREMASAKRILIRIIPENGKELRKLLKIYFYARPSPFRVRSLLSGARIPLFGVRNPLFGARSLLFDARSLLFGVQSRLFRVLYAPSWP